MLIEVPHGATRKADYDALAKRLSSRLPEQPDNFFFVNTDLHLCLVVALEGRKQMLYSVGRSALADHADRDALAATARRPAPLSGLPERSTYAKRPTRWPTGTPFLRSADGP